MNGTFMVSLDFELFWGMLEVVSLASYRDNVLGARRLFRSCCSCLKNTGFTPPGQR